MQTPTCEAAIFTRTTNKCVLSFVRYADNLYVTGGDSSYKCVRHPIIFFLPFTGEKTTNKKSNKLNPHMSHVYSANWNGGSQRDKA
jgi:hypothetical protein